MTKRQKGGRIDLTAALVAPIKVKQDGEVRAVHPHEAVLRQHTKKALADGSVPSLRFLIGEAEKHNLIKTPRPPLLGGVFVVLKGLPEDVERAIFDERPEDDAREPIWRIWKLMEPFIDMIRKQRYGNG